MDEEYARKKALMDAIVARKARKLYPEPITDSEAMLAVLMDMKESKRKMEELKAAEDVAKAANKKRQEEIMASIVARKAEESYSKPLGYRADREPDASWYRPSNHIRRIETLNKEQIERDNELQQYNETKKRHDERMKALCEFLTPIWLFGEEHRKNLCEDDSYRPPPPGWR